LKAFGNFSVLNLSFELKAGSRNLRQFRIKHFVSNIQDFLENGAEIFELFLLHLKLLPDEIFHAVLSEWGLV